jgi:regulator of replication initiation timing
MTLLKEIANDSLAENAKLKAEIERLRKEVDELKAALRRKEND